MNSRCLPLVYLQPINNRFTATGEKQPRLYIIYARNPETRRQASSGGSGTKARLSNQNEHQSRPTPERANRTSPKLQGERRQNDQNERPNGRKHDKKEKRRAAKTNAHKTPTAQRTRAAKSNDRGAYPGCRATHAEGTESKKEINGASGGKPNF